MIYTSPNYKCLSNGCTEYNMKEMSNISEQNFENLFCLLNESICKKLKCFVLKLIF